MNQEHLAYKDPREKEQSWEAFWKEKEAEIRESLKAAMNPYYETLLKYFPEDKRIRDMEKKLEKEKEFVKQLFPALLQALAQEKNVLMLVDVDETIGSGYYDAKNIFHTVIRPAFLSVLKKIQPNREAGKIDIGLLTTRNRPKEQLEDPNNLQIIKEYIHPGHIYSTGEYQPYRNSREELKDIGHKENSVLRPGLAENDYKEFSTQGSVVKLLALEDIVKNNPNKLIVVVDDFKFVNYLNPDRNLLGVHVKDEALFLVN